MAETAQSYPGEYVSGNYFAMFGINAYAGRMLTAADDQPNASPVVVMSYRLWQQKYASDVAVIGSIVNLDDRPFTVVGITPPGFFGITLRNTPPDFLSAAERRTIPLTGTSITRAPHGFGFDWAPSAGSASFFYRSGNARGIETMAAGSLGRNGCECARHLRQTLYLMPGGAGITSMREEYEHWLQILMMVTGLVLTIVCTNVANLMLVRGMERRRQTSLSIALGARLYRVIGQTLTEHLAFLVWRRRWIGRGFWLHAPDSTFHVYVVRRADQRFSFHASAIVRAGRFIDHGNRIWQALRRG